MFWGKQDFDFALICPNIIHFCPNFPKNVLGDTAASPAPTALEKHIQKS